MRIPFLPLSELALDLGSASTKVMLEGKVIWHQATCIAVHRYNRSVVCMGDAASALVGKEPVDVEVRFPIQQAEVVDRDWVQLYLGALTKSLAPLYHQQRWSQLQWRVHVPAGLTVAATQTFNQANKNALGSVKLISTQTVIQNLILQEVLPPDGAVVVIGAQTTSLFVFAQSNLVISEFFRWGTDELQQVMNQVLFQDLKLVATQDTLRRMMQQVASVHLVGKEAQNSMVIQAKSLETQTALAHVVTSQQFAPQILDSLQDFLVWLRSCVAGVPDEIQKTFLSQGVFLTGGGAQLAGLVAVVSEQLRCPVQVVSQPSLSMVSGLKPQARVNQS